MNFREIFIGFARQGFCPSIGAVNRTTNGWFVVIAAGFAAAIARLAAPSTVADVAGIAYLLTATLVFERERRIYSIGAHAPAPVNSRSS